MSASVNILGFGVMGKQLTSLCLLMGWNVTVWSRRNPVSQTELLDEQLAQDRRRLQRWIDREGSWSCVARPEDLPAAMTIETLAEHLVVKQAVISRLQFDLGSVQLITNTSSYTPNEIHEQAIGVHFFNPISALRCVELCAEEGRVEPDGQAFLDRLRAFGFTIVRAASHRGYIANSLLFREVAEALRLIEFFGYTWQAIDTVKRQTGRVISLFDVIDRVGVDITQQILRNLHAEDPTLPVPGVLDLALSRGIYGKKNGTSIRQLLDTIAHDNPIVREIRHEAGA